MSSNDSGWFGINKLRSWFPKWQWASDLGMRRFYANQIFNSDTPVLINKEDLLTPAQDCPHLQLAIAKKCEMFANGEWKCYLESDTELENPILDDDGLRLLNNPNPLQSREDFLWQYMFYKEVFSNNFIYANRGSILAQPKVLWHLPSDLMKIKLTGKIFDQYELEGIIKNFLLCYMGLEKPYAVKDIIYHATNFSLTEGMGLSKIPGLNYPISNIMASLKSRNIIMSKKGMIGIMSNEGKNTMGGVAPLQAGEQERIEKAFAQDRGLYGDRENIIITQSSVRWNATSFPVRDLMLHESDEMDFQTICDRIDIDRRCFSGTKDATYENKAQAIKGTYQNSIQPCADSFANIMTKKLAPEGRKYILDYKWLPIMGEDELQEANEEKIETERLDILHKAGIISAEQYAELAGVDFGGDGIIKLNSAKNEIGGGKTNDQLGKIPLALQQLALARERANTAGDTALSKQLSEAMDSLTNQLMNSVID